MPRLTPPPSPTVQPTSVAGPLLLRSKDASLEDLSKATPPNPNLVTPVVPMSLLSSTAPTGKNLAIEHFAHDPYDPSLT